MIAACVPVSGLMALWVVTIGVNRHGGLAVDTFLGILLVVGIMWSPAIGILIAVWRLTGCGVAAWRGRSWQDWSAVTARVLVSIRFAGMVVFFAASVVDYGQYPWIRRMMPDVETSLGVLMVIHLLALGAVGYYAQGLARLLDLSEARVAVWFAVVTSLLSQALLAMHMMPGFWHPLSGLPDAMAAPFALLIYAAPILACSVAAGMLGAGLWRVSRRVPA